MKALWWDSIDGRRELSSLLSGLGWGLLIGGFVTGTPGLSAAALVPLVAALLIRLHAMREDRQGPASSEERS